MAITAFGYACIPADNGSLDATVARAITPPANMVAGDLVRVLVLLRGGGLIDILQTGGQTWTKETQRQVTGSGKCRVFWCRFNGTWTADPSFDNNDHFVQAFTVEMIVMRPTSGANTWAGDVAEQTDNHNAPASPYNMTITGQTSIAANTVTMASWLTTVALTESLTTGGWTNPSASSQQRNTASTDTTLLSAYKIQTAAGATGNVTAQQTSGTGMGWNHLIQTFKEVVSATAPEINSMVVQSVTTSSFTVNVTPSVAATLKAVAVKVGDSIPSKTQIKSGQNAAGSAAFAAASKDITGMDVFTLIGLARPYYDIHALVTNADGDSSIVSLTKQLLAPPTGYQYKLLDFSGGTPDESLAAGASPAAATDDVGVVSLNGTAPGSCPVFLETNAVPYLSNASSSTPGQKIYWRFFDNSADAVSDADYIPSWFNNQSPVPPEPSPTINLAVNVAMTPSDLRLYFPDIQGDEVVCTDYGASAPTGTSVTASIWSGTPTVLGTTTFDIQAVDTPGDITIGSLFVHVGGVTIPDVSGIAAATAQPQLEALPVSVSVSTEYSATVDVGLVIGTVPVASTEVAPNSSVLMRVSLGEEPVSDETHFSYGVPRRYGNA